MGVNVNKNPAAEVAAPAQAPEQPKAEPMVQLELAKVERYLYAGKLYEKDKVYTFPAGALPVLFAPDQVDAAGAPMWRRYTPKKNERVVVRETVTERVAETGGPLTPAPVRTVAGVVPTEQTGKFIDLSDDDPEIAARLAAADGASGELDTGAGHVEV